jgi:hypothetical protein
MTQEKTEKKLSLVTGATKWVAASLVGLGSGAAKFVTDVRSEFHENILRSQHVKNHVRDNGRALAELRKEKRLTNSSLTTEEFIKSYSGQKSKFLDQLAEESERLGIKSKGFLGFTEGSIQRFRMLSENTKAPVLFSAVATTVIGFAGTSMFLNSIANRHAMNEIAKKHASQEVER